MTTRKQYESRRVRELSALGFAIGDRVEWRTDPTLRGRVVADPPNGSLEPDSEGIYARCEGGNLFLVPASHLRRAGASS